MGGLHCNPSTRNGWMGKLTTGPSDMTGSVQWHQGTIGSESAPFIWGLRLVWPKFTNSGQGHAADHRREDSMGMSTTNMDISALLSGTDHEDDPGLRTGAARCPSHARTTAIDLPKKIMSPQD